MQFVSESYLFKKEFYVCHCSGHKRQSLISRVLQEWCVRGGRERPCVNKNQLQRHNSPHTPKLPPVRGAHSTSARAAAAGGRGCCREDPRGQSWRGTLGRRRSVTKEQRHPWGTPLQPVGNPHRGRDTLKGLWPAGDSQRGRQPPVRRENQLAEAFTHMTTTILLHHPLPVWRSWDGQSVVTHREQKGRGDAEGAGCMLVSTGERKDKCSLKSLIANDPKHVLE